MVVNFTSPSNSTTSIHIPTTHLPHTNHLNRNLSIDKSSTIDFNSTESVPFNGSTLTSIHSNSISSKFVTREAPDPGSSMNSTLFTVPAESINTSTSTSIWNTNPAMLVTKTSLADEGMTSTTTSSKLSSTSDSGTSSGTIAGVIIGAAGETTVGTEAANGTTTGTTARTSTETSAGTTVGTSAGTVAGTTVGTSTGTSAGTTVGTSTGTPAGTTAGTSAGTVAGITAGTSTGTTAGSSIIIFSEDSVSNKSLQIDDLLSENSTVSSSLKLSSVTSSVTSTTSKSSTTSTLHNSVETTIQSSDSVMKTLSTLSDIQSKFPTKESTNKQIARDVTSEIDGLISVITSNPTDPSDPELTTDPTVSSAILNGTDPDTSSSLVETTDTTFSSTSIENVRSVVSNNRFDSPSDLSPSTSATASASSVTSTTLLSSSPSSVKLEVERLETQSSNNPSDVSSTATSSTSVTNPATSTSVTNPATTTSASFMTSITPPVQTFTELKFPRSENLSSNNESDFTSSSAVPSTFPITPISSAFISSATAPTTLPSAQSEISISQSTHSILPTSTSVVTSDHSASTSVATHPSALPELPILHSDFQSTSIVISDHSGSTTAAITHPSAQPDLAISQSDFQSTHSIPPTSTSILTSNNSVSTTVASLPSAQPLTDIPISQSDFQSTSDHSSSTTHPSVFFTELKLPRSEIQSNTSAFPPASGTSPTTNTSILTESTTSAINPSSTTSFPGTLQHQNISESTSTGTPLTQITEHLNGTTISTIEILTKNGSTFSSVPGSIKPGTTNETIEGKSLVLAPSSEHNRNTTVIPDQVITQATGTPWNNSNLHNPSSTILEHSTTTDLNPTTATSNLASIRNSTTESMDSVPESRELPKHHNRSSITSTAMDGTDSSRDVLDTLTTLNSIKIETSSSTTTESTTSETIPHWLMTERPFWLDPNFSDYPTINLTIPSTSSVSDAITSPTTNSTFSTTETTDSDWIMKVRPFWFDEKFNDSMAWNTSFVTVQNVFHSHLHSTGLSYKTESQTSELEHEGNLTLDTESPTEIPIERTLEPGTTSIDRGITPRSVPELTTTKWKMIQCPESDVWIPERDKCNHQADCPNATDEMNCSCRYRLHKSRRCDGIFDCPDIDDELGCSGCGKTKFKCSDSQHICLPLKQRCDGIEQCPDGGDETGCTLLSPSQDPHQITSPMFNYGIIQRNIEGKWYPLCSTNENLTHFYQNLCQDLVGATFGDILPSLKQINTTLYHGKYAIALNEGQKFQIVNTCPTMNVLNLKCPPPLCGKPIKTVHSNQPTRLTNGIQLNDTFILTESNPLSRGLMEDFLSEEDLEDIQQQEEIEDRIVGGHSTRQGDWPWSVAIFRNGDFICGGSLLSSYWILSAAHCFESYWKFRYEVQVGMVRHGFYSPFGQVRIVRAVYVHPNFNRTYLHNDIALILAQEPFYLNRFVSPICLPNNDSIVANKTLCTVIGWGNLKESGKLAEVLQEVQIPIIPCKSAIANRNTTICAGFSIGGKDACQGDSGGPLLCPDPNDSNRWIIAGIVSYGTGCARPNEPGIYTKVASFSNWINNTIRTDSIPDVVPITTCNGMICKNGNGFCLPHKAICNEYADCFDAEDERNCQATTTPATISATSTTIPATSTIPETPTPISASMIKELSTCSSNQFQCKKSLECIDLSKKCNLFPDCNDKTDESTCTCAEYFRKYYPDYMCDKTVDCWDFTDERHCPDRCPDGEYYSPLMKNCFPAAQKCNHSMELLTGEDESHCITLVNKEVILNDNNRPIRQQSGLIAVNKFGIWQLLCAPSWTQNLSQSICRYLGLGTNTSYSLVIGYDDVLPVIEPTEGPLWKPYDIPRSRGSFLFGYGGSLQDVIGILEATSKNSIHLKNPSLPHSLSKRESECLNVELSCSNQPCGIRPAFYHSSIFPSNSEGLWPWQGSLFRDGDYFCGTTLIAPQWLLTSRQCSDQFNLTVNYVAVILGGNRFTIWSSPTEQIRRIVNIVELPQSEVTLLYMESSIQVNEYVNPICFIAAKQVEKTLDRNNCVLSGFKGEFLSSSAKFQNPEICDPISVCGSISDNSTVCRDNWSGAIACQLDHIWYATAVYYSDCATDLHDPGKIQRYQGLWPFFSAISNYTTCDNTKSLNNNSTTMKCPAIIPAPPCQTWRCSMGNCLTADKIGNGVPDCRDRQDETCLNQSKSCLVTKLECMGFECTDGKCISLDQKCDGIEDCNGGDDEFNCTSLYFNCNSNSSERILREKVCNGYSDCSDGSDELQCLAITKVLFTGDNWLRLSTSDSSGFLVVRIAGKWFTYCWDRWESSYSLPICQSLGLAKTNVTYSKSLFIQPFSDHNDCTQVVYLGCL